MTLNEWIVFGQVGMSSKTMFAVVSNTLNAENIKNFELKYLTIKTILADVIHFGKNVSYLIPI